MPRPRFQIHLTTGVLLMFLAAGLLYLNLHDRSDPGWPLRIVPYYPNLSLTIVGAPATSTAGSANPFTQPPAPGLFDNILLKPLLANVGVSLVFLALAALYSEHLLRQRALYGTLRPRPHPLAIALFFGLLMAALWLNTIEHFGRSWSEISLPYKSAECPRYFGWPFHFQDQGSFQPRVHYDVRSLFVCGLALIAITGLPAFALHRLLRDKLRPHRATAWLLALSAVALFTLNILPEPNVIHMFDSTDLACFEYGWPQTGLMTFFYDTTEGSDRYKNDWHIHGVVANTLIALAILSAVLLLSEFLLTRRTTPREAQA